MAPHGKVLVNASIRHRLCKNDFSHLSKASRKQSKKKVRQSFESTNNSEIFNVSSGGNPILCLQKRILSPSCLPAFGKVDFCSLCRFISYCERDFSFASERDSHFFDKMIVSHFSPHVNHVKLFHLVVFDPRSVRDPGRSPCPDALLRVGVMRGVDEGLLGVLLYIAHQLTLCPTKQFLEDGVFLPPPILVSKGM